MLTEIARNNAVAEQDLSFKSKQDSKDDDEDDGKANLVAAFFKGGAGSGTSYTPSKKVFSGYTKNRTI